MLIFCMMYDGDKMGCAHKSSIEQKNTKPAVSLPARKNNNNNNNNNNDDNNNNNNNSNNNNNNNNDNNNNKL